MSAMGRKRTIHLLRGLASNLDRDGEAARTNWKKGSIMVQSISKSVDEFVTEIQPERLNAITQLRAICVRQMPNWEERMHWGMPGYGPVGRDNLVSFNNQKSFIALYAGRAALDPHRTLLMHASFGGGCVRFPKPDKIDWRAVETIVKDAYRAKG